MHDRPSKAGKWAILVNYRGVEHCLICGTATRPYLDLGEQPLANAYHRGEPSAGETFPLQIAFCPGCWHSQLTVSVRPEVMFDHYLYVSGTSKSLTAYFEWMTTEILSRWGDERPRVLELASNDGTLLRMFKDRGCECLGIDPARNLRPLTEAKGLRVLDRYWNTETARSLGEKFDIVIAVNVLPHVPDPVEFLAACKDVVSDKGRIYVQTSQCDMFRNGEFDAIYHEHLSYFTAHSFTELACRVGLTISDAMRKPIHSMSFLWELMASPGEAEDTRTRRVDELIRTERQLGMETAEFYERWGAQARQTARKLGELVTQHRRYHRVIGYGASAKSSTLLNFIRLPLDYIVDENPMKCGLLTPGMNIPILKPKTLAEEEAMVYIVALAWNFLDEIRERVRHLKRDGQYRFIEYFPEVRVTGP